MKALTICQPYAHLICLPDSDPRAKRVENRKWQASYRGPLLIHAGKNRNWLELDEDETRDEFYDIPLDDMAFGAIVGVADMVACLSIMAIRRQDARIVERFPWLNDHEHTEGPWCFVLANCRRFAEPIPYRGAQGFFDVPSDVIREAIQC